MIDATLADTYGPHLDYNTYQRRQQFIANVVGELRHDMARRNWRLEKGGRFVEGLVRPRPLKSNQTLKSNHFLEQRGASAPADFPFFPEIFYDQLSANLFLPSKLTGMAIGEEYS